MIKNFLKILILILILFLLFIGYFAYFGFTTSKFNSIIKDQIKKQNSDLDIDLKKVKLHLDLKNISIKIKTENPKIILNNSNYIELKEISSSILLSSYVQNKFAIKNLSIRSKNNEISSYINFYRLTNNSIQLILLNQFVKSGMAQINADLNFDDSGKIKSNYNLTGKILNAKLQILNNKNIKELNFNFSIKDNDYKFEKILFRFNKINFNSEFLNIQKKNDKFFVKGNLKNKKNKINNDLILLIFNDNLENFDFSNTKFDSISEFTFDLSKKFKIRNLKVDSKLNLDELILKNDLYKIKNYIKNYNNFINLKENKLHIKYSKQKILIDGSSDFYIDDNFKNLIKFQIEKSKNKTNFETFLNLENLHLIAEDISYNKIKNDNAILQIKGFKNKKKLFFRNINYKENNNKIEINNLEINNNKILNIDEVRFDYFTKNNFKNQITLIKKNNNYELTGKSFDSIKLIENISNSETDKNFFEIFKNLNSKIKIVISEVKLDDKSTVNNLNGNLEIKNSKIFDLNLNSNFSDNEKLFVSAKTQKDNSIVTTFYSDRAKPFVKKYKFIKGFEGGNLDFSSTKINNVSKSKLIIDNFKVQEVPVLAKILTLASLQGIADLLTGEGVRFTDFEMIYSNKDNVMTIDEIYAIGPAISIMMEGYVESNKLVSLRGTLVPATTINRTISSIPLLGDLLVGKKVGEGVFGVSFKIKGPPKNLKTKVNPIKTLTPRFITRTIEKIKKN
tara:strand:+ start:4 stop:2208 length:2205 start_codon:yes stop_codon:yes gene_type:complete